jgi:hypothetical protein
MKFDLQRQQFTAEQERRAKQFEYNVQQDSFNNQLKLAALQKEATPEWQYNKDLG